MDYYKLNHVVTTFVAIVRDIVFLFEKINIYPVTLDAVFDLKNVFLSLPVHQFFHQVIYIQQERQEIHLHHPI